MQIMILITEIARELKQRILETMDFASTKMATKPILLAIVTTKFAKNRDLAGLSEF